MRSLGSQPSCSSSSISKQGGESFMKLRNRFTGAICFVAATYLAAVPNSPAMAHLSIDHVAGDRTLQAGVPILLAETQGMDNRQDRRDDRQDDRQDRREDRQDCRQEEGTVGDDKRDCKQEERQDRNQGG